MIPAFSSVQRFLIYIAITLSTRAACSRSICLFVSSFVVAGGGRQYRHHHRHDRAPLSTVLCSSFSEPSDSQFGRQDYWNKVYQKEANFSWYAGFDELEPFLEEFLPSKDGHILVPGVGNDATLVGMYDAGYIHLTAMDYAEEGIERCREMLGPGRLKPSSSSSSEGVDLVVADARKLRGVFDTHSFGAIFEKGTLDAISLSGGIDKEKCNEYLNLAISELSSTLKPGGIWISLAAVVVDEIQDSFEKGYQGVWEPIVLKDDFYTTADGYTSNNIDGTLLVWKKIR